MSDDPSGNINMTAAGASAAFVEAVMKGRVVRAVGDLDDDTLNAIANSAVPAEFSALDDLIAEAPKQRKTLDG